jgi:hypothetical protein
MIKRITCIAVVGMFLCTYASADLIQYASSPWGTTYYEDPAGSIGSEFVVNQNLTLSKLGIWDENNDGLAVAHNVALFAMDGTVLASVTIVAGTSPALEDEYRWADASPVALVQGTHYIVGAYYSTTDDRFRDYATIDPAFTLVAGLYHDSPSFLMPDVKWNTSGLYSANLQAVPVPAAVLLGMLGLSVAGLKLRKFA